MKRNNFVCNSAAFALIIVVYLNLSCGKDAAPSQPPEPPPPPPLSSCATCQLLYYGGNHQSAPFMEPGTYEVAARFTPVKIGNLVGKTIKEVHYYVDSKPESIKIKIYGPDDETTPGDLLYSADVTAATGRSKWNLHNLAETITLKNEDVWLSIEIKVAVGQRIIGCDPGPALPDGDWFYSYTTQLWRTYTVYSAGESINWNIRFNVAL